MNAKARLYYSVMLTKNFPDYKYKIQSLIEEIDFLLSLMPDNAKILKVYSYLIKYASEYKIELIKVIKYSLSETNFKSKIELEIISILNTLIDIFLKSISDPDLTKEEFEFTATNISTQVMNDLDDTIDKAIDELEEETETNDLEEVEDKDADIEEESNEESNEELDEGSGIQDFSAFGQVEPIKTTKSITIQNRLKK